jgi:hypothetical protein
MHRYNFRQGVFADMQYKTTAAHECTALHCTAFSVWLLTNWRDAFAMQLEHLSVREQEMVLPYDSDVF